MTEKFSMRVSTTYLKPLVILKKNQKPWKERLNPCLFHLLIRYCLLIPSFETGWLFDIVFVCVGVPLSKYEEKK